MLALFIDNHVFISKNTFNCVLLLAIIVTIGLFSSFFYSITWYDWFKDLAYFSKPIIALISGFYLASKIKDTRFLSKVIVVVALFTAIAHLLKVIYAIDFGESSVSDIRRVGGISNMFEVVAIILLLISYRFDSFQIFNSKSVRNVIFITLCLSFMLYFSRTMFVALIIFYLSISGYLKLTSKGLKYLSVTLVLFSLFYAYLFSIEIERDKPGIQSFLYKLKIAPAEIFIPSKDIDIKSHESLWDHWRAYEAARAFEELNKTPLTYINGKGFGGLVDLKFEAPLGDHDIRYIPILHNGYVYIVFKTGIIGLIIYLLFLLLLYLNAYKDKESREMSLVANLIAGISIYYFFSTLIITGIYNMIDIFSFMLGVLFFVQHYLNKKNITN